MSARPPRSLVAYATAGSEGQTAPIAARLAARQAWADQVVMSSISSA